MGLAIFTTIIVDYGVAPCFVPQASLELPMKSTLALTL